MTLARHPHTTRPDIALAAAPGAEWSPILIVCGVYLAFAFAIVSRGGYEAQDFEAHYSFLQLTLDGRWYLSGLTNPPLLYLYTEAFIRVFGEPRGLALACASFALLNAGALVLLWRCARRILSTRASLLTLALLATLPAFVTTSVVFAADALVIPPFLLFCYLNVRLLEQKTQSVRLLLSSTAAQVWGGIAKYSFSGVAPAALVVGAALARRRRDRPRAAIAALLLVFAVPTAINVLVMKQLGGAAGHYLGFLPPAGAITIRSLVWPYARDLELFAAPSYFDPIVVDGKQIRVRADGTPDPDGRPGLRVLVDNRYSYPALVNLAIHSDVMNITRRRFSGTNAFTETGESRPLNLAFQRASVALGALLCLIVVASVVHQGFSMLRGRTPPEPAVSNFLLGVLLPALIFYGLIVGMLPFVGNESYYAGYWLPRFVIPALLVFGVAGAWAVSSTVRRPPLRACVIALALCKLGVQVGLQF